MHNSERRARGSPVAVAPKSNRGHNTNSRRKKPTGTDAIEAPGGNLSDEATALL